MTYFPEPAFQNIASFLVDPYYKDKEEHAKVWQKICVMRRVYTITDHYIAHDYWVGYEVLVIGSNLRSTISSEIETSHFGFDEVSGEWDNVVQRFEVYKVDGSKQEVRTELHNMHYDYTW